MSPEKPTWISFIDFHFKAFVFRHFKSKAEIISANCGDRISENKMNNLTLFFPNETPCLRKKQKFWLPNLDSKTVLSTAALSKGLT